LALRILSVFVLSWAILGRPSAAQERTGVGRAHADTLTTSPGGKLQLRPFVVPGTIVLRAGGRILAASAWTADEAAGRVTVDLPAGTQVVATYRAFPLAVGPEFRLNREPLPVPDRVARAAVRPGPSRTRPQSGGLRSRGAISRGITAGSGRDASIESGLRLEVDGSPAPGVEVRAVLTDESTPIRPDGTTQRLSEFDRVSVEIDSRSGQVRMGDVDVHLGASRFATFSRKVQGVAVRSALGDPETAPVSLGIQAAGAAARGIFHVQRITPVDGMQGPYRLEGREGELFVLVIAGSETVYVDGERLERGATLDYTIDYSTAEITFMPRVPVTADRRIEVEFTYSINQYTRTVVATEGQAAFWPAPGGRHRATLGISWLREADGSRFTDEFGLSSADSLRLAASGDAEAVRSGAIEVVFDPEAPYVQYRREVRTGGDGSPDTVYVALEAAPMEGETVYRVRFSRVGTGQGRYAREGQSINGIVYVYRGAGGGDYEPVRRLPRPELRRLLDLRGSVSPVEGVTVRAEWARSVNDLNRLSGVDSGDDAGDAFAGTVDLVLPVAVASGRLTGGAALVRRSAHFISFDRTRAVEFGREWNLGRRTVDAVGSIGSVGLESEADVHVAWSGGDSTVVRAEAGRLEVGDLFDGRRVRLSAHAYEPGLPGLRYAVDRVGTDDFEFGERGHWELHRGRIEAPPTGRIRPYVEMEREIRRQRLDGDTLSALSIGSIELRPGLEWTDDRASAVFEVERRTDEWPTGTRLEAASSSWTGTARARFAPSGEWSTSGEVSWRRRTFTEAFAGRADARDTRSLSLSLTGDGRPASRIRLGWMYQARSERSPTLQEVYFRAGPDRGEYVWADDNGDGVIQVDEFVPETTPDEGLYVRTWLPSDSLASVTVAQARIRLALEPGHGTPGLAGRVSGQTLVEVEERSRTGRRSDVYLLRLDRFRVPGTTLNGRLRFRQDISLFRGSPAFGVDASWDVSRALSELAAGRESRRLDRRQVAVRGRPHASLDLAVDLVHERNATDSDAFASRRFDLLTRAVAPSIRYRLGRATTARAELSLAWKTDRRVERSATVVRLPVALRTGLSDVVDLSVRLEAADARVRGAVAGLAAWEMTEGRGAGRSLLWGTTLQWAASRVLRATVAYDGRAPATGAAIHTGRVELSAIF
jgi:hypothetical protein